MSQFICQVIYHTRGRVFYKDITTARSGLKKWKSAQPSFLKTEFEAFGYLIKHPSSCLMYFLKPIEKMRIRSR